MHNVDKFFDKVQFLTEKALTKKKAKNQYKKDHRTVVSEILDWLDAILFAVVVVLILNLFLFQLFVIPSPSMQNTLMVGDRVLVGKFTYGCELYPEGPKVFTGRIPDRDEIITFYNPQYESKGGAFSTFSTVLYMATFSLVNIDRNEDGTIAEKLLVKRTAGVSGDTVKFLDGDAWIKPSGTSDYVKESDFRQNNGLSTAPHRTINADTYKAYNAYARIQGLLEGGLESKDVSSHLVSDYQKLNKNDFFTDYWCFEKQLAAGKRIADPASVSFRSQWTKYDAGIYVPENCVLPLGDNRDNSGDGRYFGPVNVEKINGHVVNIIWPFKHSKGLLGK